MGVDIRRVGALCLSMLGGSRQRSVLGRAWMMIGWSYAMVVGRSLEIWSLGMDLAEDTWSEVSLGISGMAIVVVENQHTYSNCSQ